MQYKQTLPLKDHEVVLTFDDGPIPPYSNIILDTLAANCVKATYFMVGEMAHAYPYRSAASTMTATPSARIASTIRSRCERLSMQRVEREVDGGIASVDAALGDPKAVSPFFRIPGLGRTNAIEHFLEAKGLVTWSADIDTNDWWRGTTPGAVLQRAMRRLNARGRGILLMHDIHPATALALPTLLKELKAQGYHVVQVVAAGERPEIAARTGGHGRRERATGRACCAPTPKRPAAPPWRCATRSRSRSPSRHHRSEAASAAEGQVRAGRDWHD